MTRAAPPASRPHGPRHGPRGWTGGAGRRLAVAAVLATSLFVVVAPQHVDAWSADRLALAAVRHGPLAEDGARQLRTLVAQAARLDDAARLELVNDFFNRRITFTEDSALWGLVDHWASPLEMLGRGRGDCEDYAIAKYFVLRAAGVPVQRLRLVYVRAQVAGGPTAAIPHLVLAWYAQPTADPMVLDNLVPDVQPASRRPDLTPVFSFNSDGLWQGVGGPSAGDPVQRLSKWREVLAKAREEGFD